MAFAKAKSELIEFLKHAPKSKDRQYEITMPLMSEEDAQKFVHRMRVELCRFRTDVELQGKTIRPFKMLIESIKHENINTLIVLRYRDTTDKKILKDIDDVFDVISTGSKLLNEEATSNFPAKPLRF